MLQNFHRSWSLEQRFRNTIRFISNDINHFLWSVDLTLRISRYFDSKLFKISQVSPKMFVRFQIFPKMFVRFQIVVLKIIEGKMAQLWVMMILFCDPLLRLKLCLLLLLPTNKLSTAYKYELSINLNVNHNSTVMLSRLIQLSAFIDIVFLHNFTSISYLSFHFVFVKQAI